jgi:hypothetical protein
MHQAWKQQLSELSGNLTTNSVMPEHITRALLDENLEMKNKISLKEIQFARLGDKTLDNIEGLNILAGLQGKSRKGYLTLFRAVRFPTYKRIYEVLSKSGFTISNFEQERILDLYTNKEYIAKRTQIQEDSRFWVMPQERVVHGVPLFTLVNDALQIHRAFRGKEDKVLIIAIHIPRELVESGKLKLIANTAIDLDYTNTDRDWMITDFSEKNGIFEPDYEALRMRGIDLHEMYSQDLPMGLQSAQALGITQEFFLLDIYEITDLEAINALRQETILLKEHKNFLHGFFGDQNIFGRRSAKYLPFRCSQVSLMQTS